MAALPRAGLPARGAAQLPRPARLGDRAPTATSSPWRRWSRSSRSATSTPTRRASTSRRPRPSTPSHMRLLSIDEITHRVLPFLKDAGVVGDPVPRRRRPAARAGDAAGRRADQQAHRGRRRCSASCSSTRPTSSATPTTSPSCSTRRAAASSRRRTTPSSGLHEWSTAAIEEALRVALVEGLELKPRVRLRSGARRRHRHADQPAAVRVAGAAGPRAQPRAPAVAPWPDAVPRTAGPRRSGRATTSCTGSAGPAGGARSSASCCSSSWSSPSCRSWSGASPSCCCSPRAAGASAASTAPRPDGGGDARRARAAQPRHWPRRSR